MRAYLAIVAIVSAIYLPQLGKGFIKDDFRWIDTGRVQTVRDLRRIATENVGFYRPIVTLSFSVDYALFGLRPFGYGLTNLTILALCLWSIRALSQSLGLTDGATAVAMAIWSLNFHGIGGALLWLSGRTALLLCLFWVLSVQSMLRGRFVLSLCSLALALFTKEEAFLLPGLLVGIALWRGHRDRLWTFIAGAIILLGLYSYLRVASGAIGPINAPAYYRLTFAPLGLVRNVLEYADRTFTYAVLVTVVAAVATLRFRPDPPRSLLLFCVAWLAASYGITLFVPVRSSLYAVLPSVASGLVAGAIVEGFRMKATGPGARRLVIAGVLLLVVSTPVYWLRNRRLADLASFSQRIVRSLQERNGEITPGAIVVLSDRPHETRLTLAEAFGALTDSVNRLAVPSASRLQIETAAGLTDESVASTRPLVRLRVRSDGSGLEP